MLIVGAFRFPDGDAAAARVLGLGKALRETGHRVVFAGWEKSPRGSDLDADGVARFQGFEYHSQAEFRDESLSPIKRLFGYIFAGKKTLDWVVAFGLKPGDRVIAYHGRALFLVRLLRVCQRSSAELHFDCTEWYAPENLIGGRFGVAAVEDWIRMTIVNRMIGRGLVISRFLESYYTDRRVDVLRVPPMVDSGEQKWIEAAPSRTDGCGDRLILSYAGVPGKKDAIGAVLAAMDSLRRKGFDVVIDMIGPTRADLSHVGPGVGVLVDSLGSAIRFHGRVPQERVPGLLKGSDFTVLLRPEARVSHAGFPTKVVESLASGVPVICNLTGDIGLYVKDGVHGLIAANCSAEAMELVLLKAARTSRLERAAMSTAARHLAVSELDYRCFVGEICAHVMEGDGEGRVGMEGSDP